MNRPCKPIGWPTISGLSGSSGEGGRESYIRDIKRLDHSIQHLCQHEVLFQGCEWSCGHCQNRNWVGIDRLARTLECEVCGRREPAPVAGDWHFRGNPFVISAYRDHGIEPVVFALW